MHCSLYLPPTPHFCLVHPFSSSSQLRGHSLRDRHCTVCVVSHVLTVSAPVVHVLSSASSYLLARMTSWLLSYPLLLQEDWDHVWFFLILAAAAHCAAWLMGPLHQYWLNTVSKWVKWSIHHGNVFPFPQRTWVWPCSSPPELPSLVHRRKSVTML